jgi:hypothetical protein
VFEARFGKLKATVWQRTSDKGAWFNVTLSRTYKDGSGGWQNASSFGVRDLLEVGKLCDMAHSWIYREFAKERARNGRGSDAQAVDADIPF